MKSKLIVSLAFMSVMGLMTVLSPCQAQGQVTARAVVVLVVVRPAGVDFSPEESTIDSAAVAGGDLVHEPGITFRGSGRFLLQVNSARMGPSLRINFRNGGFRTIKKRDLLNASSVEIVHLDI